VSRGRSPNRALAALALALGVLAPIVGSPFPPASPLDPDGSARIRAAELAGWLRERRPVRVIDLRDSAPFADFHLPTATRVGEEALTTLGLTPADTVVLYGGDAVVARALDILGGPSTRVRYMLDGVGEWVSDVMNPLLAPDATAAERDAFAGVAALSRYFGGMPRIGVRDSSESASLLERTQRRGCAF